MKINRHTINLGPAEICFFAPENDSTFPGTCAALTKDEFSLGKVNFAENDVVIDIGCNVGIISMVLAKIYPFIKIYSFDANPLTINCLKEACNENKITNIQAFNLGIGAEFKKDVDFYTYSENETCLIEGSVMNNNRPFNYKTNVISVESIFDSEILGINKVKYCKIDVEGCEFEIFNKLFENRLDILDRIQYLHVEIHPFTGNPRSEKLKLMLKEKFGERVLF